MDHRSPSPGLAAGVRQAGLLILQALLLILAVVIASPDAWAQPADQLVEQAREAARTDRNAESADLFRRAIEADPALRPSVLREYADQLTYSGRAAEAVPLYKDVLAGQPPAEELTRAERGLALALLWSDQSDEAVTAWTRISDAAPDDQDARKNLREALLKAAQTAASRNQNARAAELFSRAIALDPARRMELLRDYADQLTFSGRASEAVPLYRQALAGGKLTAEEESRTRRGLALAYLWSGRYSEAITAWRPFLKANPRDFDARKNATEALIGAARQAASADRNAESANLFASAIALSPGRRVELGVEYANQLTYSSRADAAIPVYREVLSAPRIDGATRRSAMLGLALALDWSGQTHDSLDVYDEIVSAYPESVEALIGRGNILTQLDRNREALADFERAILLAPANREPVWRSARSLSYLGRQRLALERLAPLIESDNDREAMRVAARAEQWMGRTDRAYARALRLLEADPNDAEAQRIRDEIALSQRPLTEVDSFIAKQNDGLILSGATLRQSVGLRDGLAMAGVQTRLLGFNPDSGDSIQIEGLGVFGRNRFNDAFELNASVYLNRIVSADFDRIEPTYDAWLTYWHSDTLRFDASASRSFFDDVKSISLNIMVDSFGLSMDVLPDEDLRISARASYGSITDGNQRVIGQIEAERRVFAKPLIHVGARYGYQNYTKPELDNGYFDPDWLNSIEATLRIQLQPHEGWYLSAYGTGGYEWQPGEAKPIFGGALTASYAPSPRFRLDVELRHQNSAATGGSDSYNRTTLSGGFEYRW